MFVVILNLNNKILENNYLKMMQSVFRKAYKMNMSVRYSSVHREMNDTIRATGLTNPNVVRNPT